MIDQKKNWLIIGCDDGSIKIMDIITLNFKKVINLAHCGGICVLEIYFDNKYFVSGSRDGSIKIWKVGDWELDYSFEKAHSGNTIKKV